MEHKYIAAIALLGLLIFVLASMKNAGINYNIIMSEEEAGLESDACGGVIYSSNGTINYKLEEPFKGGERCTWTVHSPNATKITFEVVDNGFIQSNVESLKVGYFLDSDYKTVGNYQEVVLNYSSINNKVEVPGPVAFLRFYPYRYQTSVSGLGFSIKFSSVSSAISLPFKYQNFHISKNFGKINYPANGKSYQPLERVTFVLKPQVAVTLALKYFHGNCGVQQDYLTVYQRTMTSDYNYKDSIQLLQQFCNSSISSVPHWSIDSTNEVLITFHSSISGTNNGFELIWVP